MCAACEHSLGREERVCGCSWEETLENSAPSSDPALLSGFGSAVHPLAVLLSFWEMGLAAHTLL